MFDNRMAEARKRLNLTQKQVADKAKVQPSTYSSYENNKKIPPLDIALRIADALGVSISWLCGKESTPKYSTYGTVARAIISAYLGLLEGKNITTELYIDDSRYMGDFNIPVEAITLETTAPQLTSFFRKMQQFRQMSIDNKDASEMYDAWLKGELEKLDNEYVDEEAYIPF